MFTRKATVVFILVLLGISAALAVNDPARDYLSTFSPPDGDKAIYSSDTLLRLELDLDGDGQYELLLAAPKIVYTSSSGIVEMLLSRGVDLAINIRALHRGVYSKSPDASLDVTGAIAPDRGAPELFILDGDFNADGRKDLLIRRTLQEWDVYFSSRLGTWFREKPGARFESPLDGDPEIQDLNGDGFSDLAIERWDDPRIVIFLSRVQPAQSK